MDDGELIRRMKNSYRRGKSVEEVTRSMLKQGYRLEYINLLNRRAFGVSRLTVILFSIILVLFFAFTASSGYVAYVVLEPKSLDEKEKISNPLEGVNVNFGTKRIVVDGEGDSVIVGSLVSDSFSGVGEDVYVDDLEITPEFITYLLNELGVWQLRSNPITGSKPVLNFLIEGDSFHSVVDDSLIKTERGLSLDSDVTLISGKSEIVRAMVSENPSKVFRESFNAGRSGLEMNKGEAQLFAKGYFVLYNSLSS